MVWNTVGEIEVGDFTDVITAKDRFKFEFCKFVVFPPCRSKGLWANGAIDSVLVAPPTGRYICAILFC